MNKAAGQSIKIAGVKNSKNDVIFLGVFAKVRKK